MNYAKTGFRLDDVLADDLVLTMMQADGVAAADIRAMLQDVIRRQDLAGPRRIDGARHQVPAPLRITLCGTRRRNRLWRSWGCAA
jgi:hypothetical protein